MRNYYKWIVLFFYLLIHYPTSAQPFFTQWVKTQGKVNKFSGVSSVKCASNGHVYICGAGDNDFFVKKYDAKGGLLWDKTFLGSGIDYATSLVMDGNENIYITGYFQNTIDFDPGPNTASRTSAGNTDYFILSLSSSGHYRWAHSFGATEDDNGNSVAFSNDGSVYVTGSYEGTVDFDPSSSSHNLMSVGYIDVFVHKIDTSGNFIWAKSIGGSSYDHGYSIVTDKTGSVYLAGYFFSTIDCDPGSGVYSLTSAGNRDILLVKLDSAGNFLWANRHGAANEDRAQGVHLTNDGELVITGYFTDSVDFDPGAAELKLFCPIVGTFIQKLDTAGKLIWVKSIGDRVWARSVISGSDKNIFVGGYYALTVDFDPNAGVENRQSVSSEDIFLLTLDSAGQFVDVLTLGGTGDDLATAVETGLRGNVYLGGYFRRTVDFDPTANTKDITAIGIADYMVMKLAACEKVNEVTTSITSCTDYTSATGKIYSVSGTYTDIVAGSNGCDSIITLQLTRVNPTTATIQTTACKNYTSPSGKYVYTKTGVYIDTLINKQGCDSLLTIQLTIDTISSTIIVNGLTLQAPPSLDSYQWVDCNSNYSVVNNGQNRLFTAVKNGRYAVIVKKGVCVDTSACYTINGVGIISNPTLPLIETFPNPVTNQLGIHLGAMCHSIEVTVYNMQGKKIMSGNYNEASQVAIDFDFENGVYYVEIKTDYQTLITKVVKM
ncbi:MAG: T9SS type A sorting domain-containing protein [Bacteroidota bacterium]